jgi:hypothetical protein
LCFDHPIPPPAPFEGYAALLRRPDPIGLPFALSDPDLGDHEPTHLMLRVIGDGRIYGVCIYEEAELTGGAMLFRAQVQTADLAGGGAGAGADGSEAAPGHFETDPRDGARVQVLRLPLAAFAHVVEGVPVETGVRPRPARLRNWGLVIGDGVSGPFRLEVRDWRPEVQF